MTNDANAIKTDKKKRASRAIALILVAVLLCAMLTGVLMARYAASSDTVNNSARVAAFSVSAASGDTTDLSITQLDRAGNTSGHDDYSVTVYNDSEVAVSYSLTVKITQNDLQNETSNTTNGGVAFEGGLSAALYPVGEDGEPDESGKIEATVTSETEAAFANVGTFDPGDENADYVLRFTYDNGGADIDGTYTYEVSVDFTQID